MTLMSATSAPRTPGGLRMTPGRRVAVLSAVPVAIALIGWTGFSLVGLFAQGSYPFSYAVPVHHGQIAVNVNGGNVTLRQALGPSARLTGTVQYDLIRPGLTESMSASRLDVGLLNCLGVGSGCGLNAALDVPSRTAVTLWSDGGDISVSGFTSPMTLQSGGGNITASNLAGDLRLDTGGGDLTFSGLGGLAGARLTGNIQIFTEGGNVSASNLGNVSSSLQLDTGGGDVSANGVFGQAKLLTEGGNINLDFVGSPTFNADSGGGDVTLNFTERPVNVQITTDGGNVTVVLPPGGIGYDILTPGLDGGTVNIPHSLYSDSASAPTISVDSGGGDITITQQN
jgi:hypothetical protein